MKAFSIGSCRTQIALWNIHPLFERQKKINSVRCHYLSEMIQIVNFLRGKIDIPKQISKTVFTDPKTYYTKKAQILHYLNTSEKYIVEISSIKNLKQKEFFHNINQVSRKDRENYEFFEDTVEDIISKMKILNALLDGKPTLYVPHINIELPDKGLIRQRVVLQQGVKAGSDAIKQNFFDITDYVNEVGIENAFKINKNGIDVNHLKPTATKYVQNQIEKFLRGGL